MMDTSKTQPSMFFHINRGQFVRADHPKRNNRSLIDMDRFGSCASPSILRWVAPQFRMEHWVWSSWASHQNMPWCMSSMVSLRIQHGNNN